MPVKYIKYTHIFIYLFFCLSSFLVLLPLSPSLFCCASFDVSFSNRQPCRLRDVWRPRYLYHGTGDPDCHMVMLESPEAIDIHFWLYTTSNPDTPQEIIRTSATLITNSNFDASRDTKFIIHGYMDSYSSSWHQATKDALLTHVRRPMFEFDWIYFSSHYESNQGIDAALIISKGLGYGIKSLLKYHNCLGKRNRTPSTRIGQCSSRSELLSHGMTASHSICTYIALV